MGRLTRLTLSLTAAFTAGILAGAGLIQHHVTHYQVVSSQTDSIARVIPWEARHTALAPTTTTTVKRRAPVTTTTTVAKPEVTTPTSVYTPPTTSGNVTATANPAPVISGNGFQACVISRESGGNPQIFSPSGTYWGLYQFSYSTWVANGGAPGDWGHAGAAEQTAVFDRSSPSNWAPYDGC